VLDVTTILTVKRKYVAAAGALAITVLALAGPARTATPPTLLCKLPQKAKKLPATARHGLVQHLRQYPSPRLATPRERARAREIHAELVAAAARGKWRDLQAVARAGYDTRTAPRRAGDLSIRYFHAERNQEPRRVILNPRRPKALIYANAPGRSLALVGAMWSTRRGERGPTPAGPIMRWHSHVICSDGVRRGLKPPASGRCPPGTQLRQGRSEMLHVWFTRDLRSAFAIRAPEPELCAAGLLPHARCARAR
jgi:hypothetical protein